MGDSQWGWSVGEFVGFAGQLQEFIVDDSFEQSTCTVRRVLSPLVFSSALYCHSSGLVSKEIVSINVCINSFA